METVLANLGIDGWTEFWWIAVGLCGQLAFSARFLVQWIMSERAGRSVIPVAFWWLSITGGVVLLSYAIYRLDPVFILGQSMGVFIYVRNLWLIYTEKRAALRDHDAVQDPEKRI